MATLQLNGKTLATQASSAEPVLGSNLTFPSGHVLQVIHGTYATTTTHASASFSGAITNLKAPSITTGTNGNKVIITVSLPVYVSSADKQVYGTLYRGSTQLSSTGLGLTMSVGGGWMDNLYFTYVDTVATAGGYVYGVDIKSSSASNVVDCYNNTVFSIICTEIQA